MKYTTIPHTDIEVSRICLGTMTWGNQNTQEEGFEQMNYSLSKGVNFFDTAELYPVPANADTYAETERIIGNWFASRNNREQVVLATKIAGPGAYTAHIRSTGFSPESIHQALDGSLQRLKTDYIDLYQLHWPERNSNFFGTLGYVPQENEEWKENFEEILHTLYQCIKAGKIRHIGISNESPWGAMKYIALSEFKNLPRMKTIQKEWKNIGPVSKTLSKEIWLEFRSHADKFFSARKKYIEIERNKFKANYDQKILLINTAKKYVENIEKDSNPILIKKLQENWKKIGHAGKYAEQKLWKKFRTQCDAFFDQKNAAKNALYEEEKKNLTLKKELIKTFTAKKEVNFEGLTTFID